MEGSHGFRLAKKLSVTGNVLVRWNKNSFGNTKEKIKDLEDKLLKIQQATPTKENLNLEASLIPKKKGAHNFNHFRLIGLCNVFYKVI